MRKYTLTPSRKAMGKAVARRSKQSLIVQALKDPVTKVFIVKKIGILLKQELTQMCSDKAKSFLQYQSASVLEFEWDTLIAELSIHAPVLLSLLSSCTMTRKPRQNSSAVIGMCCTLLLKFRYFFIRCNLNNSDFYCHYRYSKMCLIQKAVSLILYASNCGKQVIIVTFF